VDLPAFDPREFEHRLYEAAIVPELWPDVLTKLGDVSNSAGAALRCINERGVHFTSSPVLDNIMTRFVNEGWDNRNSRRGNVMAKGLVGVPRFVNEDDYLAPGEAETDPMINELFRSEGFGWAAGFIQDLPHGDLVVLNLEQYYERGPIRGDALERLNTIYPHLARASVIAGRADFARVRSAIETLSALGLPAAALTPNMRVVLANDGFAAATHVWTTRGGDRIGLHDPVADGLLAGSIQNLDAPGAPRSIPVRAAAGGALTAIVQVAPIRRAAHDIFGSTAAIVVLSEPRQGTLAPTLIHSLFDVTPAELAVARGIAAGRTVTQLAQFSGRSVNTIRNQLQSVMTKMGCSRQVELALLMQQLDGPTPPAGTVGG
jgi:DNA-binding CsgD family transcriptional regulator